MAEPKHQWMVRYLRGYDEAGMIKQFQAILSQLTESTHTVILSTEGVFNHWWDLSSEAKSMLKIFTDYFAVKVWLWFREPESFLNSLYRQYLANPQGWECYQGHLIKITI